VRDDRALQETPREIGKSSPEMQQLLEQLLRGGLDAGAGVDE
jgi:hypothetical protein